MARWTSSLLLVATLGAVALHCSPAVRDTVSPPVTVTPVVTVTSVAPPPSAEPSSAPTAKPVADGSVQCGAAACTGRIPVCCWNTAKKTAFCAKDCPDRADVAELSCTSPDDCDDAACGDDAGLPAATGKDHLVLACRPREELKNSMRRACRTVRDCPEKSKYGFDLYGCEDAFPHLPPGSKWCVYGAE